MERHLRQVLPELLKCLRVDPLLMEHLHAARVLDLHYWHTIEVSRCYVKIIGAFGTGIIFNVNLCFFKNESRPRNHGIIFYFPSHGLNQPIWVRLM